jgi:hypothetical protein
MATTKRFIKLSVVTVIAAAVLVLNPVFGLLSDEDYEFSFGAPELRVAVEGTWRLTLGPAHAPDRTITFTLAQGAEESQTHAARTLVRSAAACASRSLVKSAGACVDSTYMPLDLTVIADGQPESRSKQARFFVDGGRFASGYLLAAIGDADVEARLSPDGDVNSVSVYVSSPAGSAGHKVPATLVRIAR